MLTLFLSSLLSKIIVEYAYNYKGREFSNTKKIIMMLKLVFKMSFIICKMHLYF